MVTTGFVHGGQKTSAIERNRTSVFRGVEMLDHRPGGKAASGTSCLAEGFHPGIPAPFLAGDASCPAHEGHLSMPELRGAFPQATVQ